MSRSDVEWTDPVAWTFVLLANLILPGMLGYALAGDSGMPGMLTAVAILWAGGAWVCLWHPRHGVPLLVGGTITALLQVAPVLQWVAGFLAVTIWEFLTGGSLLAHSDSRSLSFVPAFT